MSKPPRSERQETLLAIAQIVLPYIALGSLWILVSDPLTERYITDPATRLTINVAKGWLFVLVTAALLAGLLYRLLGEKIRRRHEAEATNQRLEAQHSYLQTLLDTLPDLVWVKDPNGAYLSCKSEDVKPLIQGDLGK